MAVQSLLLTSSISKYSQTSNQILTGLGTPEFITIGGWILLKSDVLDLES
ncbi:MAG: hypothetical protein U1C48_05330 [Methylotenera sp.]|nr:hypothetical protein [Methylotenera sp.]